MWKIPKENKEGRVFMALDIFFLVLAFISVFLRLWARRINRSSVDASEITCLAALALSVGLTVILWACFSHGWGLNITSFTPEYADLAWKLFPTIMIIWNASVCLVRVSMLLFYIRLFHISAWRTVFWIFVGLNISSLISIAFSALFICRPLRFTYDKTVVGGYCGDLLALQRFTAVWNLLMDVAIVVLPMPIVWGLKMTTRKKIGVTLMFGMGIVICLMTLTRIFISAFYMVNNVTRQNAVVVFITGLEPVVGIINACLPHFPPVFRLLGSTRFVSSLSNVFNSTHAKSTMQDNTGGSYSFGSAHKRRTTTDFHKFSDSDTVELTSQANDYSGGGIQIRHDVHIKNSSVV